jgi:hypothetical protein
VSISGNFFNLLVSSISWAALRRCPGRDKLMLTFSATLSFISSSRKQSSMSAMSSSSEETGSSDKPAFGLLRLSELDELTSGSRLKELGLKLIFLRLTLLLSLNEN